MSDNHKELTISVSGITNSGKTTLARHLAEFLRLTGWDVDLSKDAMTEARSTPRRSNEAEVVQVIKNRTKLVIKEVTLCRSAKET